jgi:hypothetical protein
MRAPADELVGFAYGEELEEGTQRSLGYRLLAPARPEPWCGEVEALARRLQAAPYSDHWPATDLFGSVLLANGARLVALARYGLSDHTPARRRGGLELIGVVGPAALDVPTALALYRWLAQRRAGADDLHQLGGAFRLAEVLAALPPAPAEPGPAHPDGWAGPVPVLPVRLWQEGAFLFAASTPADPDHHRRLLELAAGPGWQWLPLVGPDFPLATYAQRGPLIAWTPHLAGVALKLDRRASDTAPAAPAPARSRGPRLLAALLVLVLLGLLGGNLWLLHDLRQQVVAGAAREQAPPAPAQAVRPPPAPPPPDDSRERFVAALHRLLVQKGGAGELTEGRAALLDRYEELAERDKGLRLRDDDVQGKATVAAIAALAGRGADRIEAALRKALEGKGYSDELIKAACADVRKQFAAEGRDKRP